MRRKNSIFASGLASAAIVVLALSGCASSSTPGADDGCTPESTFTTIKEGVLTVAVPELPPYSSTTGEGGMGGIDGEIVRTFAKNECLTIEVQAVSPSAAIPSVENGRADIALGGWSRTNKRAEVLNMSAPLYLDDMGLISKDGYTDFSEFEGQNVGTIEGYRWVDNLRAIYGDKLSTYATTLNLVQDMEAGRIDVGVDAFASAVAVVDPDEFSVEVAKADDRVKSSLKPAQCGLPISKGNPELLKAFDATVAALHKDGQMEKILASFDLPASSADTGDPYFVD